MVDIIKIECPFCKEITIDMMCVPEVYSSHTIRIGSNKKTIPKLTHAKDEVISEKCSNCSKTKKEIEKALKEGIPPSREEIIRRAKEAGLPLKIK